MQRRASWPQGHVFASAAPALEAQVRRGARGSSSPQPLYLQPSPRLRDTTQCPPSAPPCLTLGTLTVKYPIPDRRQPTAPRTRPRRNYRQQYFFPGSGRCPLARTASAQPGSRWAMNTDAPRTSRPDRGRWGVADEVEQPGVRRRSAARGGGTPSGQRTERITSPQLDAVRARRGSNVVPARQSWTPQNRTRTVLGPAPTSSVFTPPGVPLVSISAHRREAEDAAQNSTHMTNTSRSWLKPSAEGVLTGGG